VLRAFLEKRIRDLNEHLQGCVAELVSDLGELGCVDWEDRQTRTVIVVAIMDGHMIYPAISRKVKHISVIACVLAVGESLLLCIKKSESSSPVQEQLRTQDVRFGRVLIFKYNGRPDGNAEIFLDYIKTAVLPILCGFEVWPNLPQRTGFCSWITVRLMSPMI
jgi:hypothetical protein